MSLPRKRHRRKKRASSWPQRHRNPHILLLIETSRAFGREIVEGIARYALENGPWTIQFEDRTLDSLPPAWLKEWRGEGIIARTVDIKMARMLWATKLPLVELYGDPRINTARVTWDNDALGRMAIEHFLNCGLRRFAYFTYGESWWTVKHYAAFRKLLEEQGFDSSSYTPPRSRRKMPVWHESQIPGIIQWLASLPRPIGIYTAGDLNAVRLIHICRELDIAVPEEMAILGVGNDAVICETVHPTLSSIDLNARRVGYEAAQLLDGMMAGKHPKDIVHIPPSHVAVRQSTDLMVIDDADVIRATRFIRECACRGIDVSRVTDEVGLSRSALERRFLHYLGRTPKAEIMRIRIEHAKMLLAQTDKTSESIALRSGFSSLAYFTRAFHREVGMTPYAYRRMRRISKEAVETIRQGDASLDIPRTKR
jgi:LacI family transcriptional regulator